MKKLLYIFSLLVLLTACSEDEAVAPQAEETITLEIPIYWTPEVGGTERGGRVGDPGVDDECPTPPNIYIFTWLKEDETKYLLHYDKKENLRKEAWIPADDRSGSYMLADNYSFVLRLPTPYNYNYENGYQVGRTYAIATGDGCHLTDEQVRNITGFDITAGETAETTIDILNRLENALLDTGEWTRNSFYRDLYSTPHNDDTEYLNGKFQTDGGIKEEYFIKNGYIIYSTEIDPKNRSVFHGDVHLYHAAAKIDFQWEVAADLRSTTAIESITVTGLPTTCRIFRPTQNPSDAATQSLAINDGNRWIGREYCYQLQPANGAISYSVAFKDVDGDGTKKDAITPIFPKPVPFNEVFTGWYRIVATVK